MITVNAKEFRSRLSYYLDELERGQEITIIRHSVVIGTVQPAFPAPTDDSTIATHKLQTGQKAEERPKSLNTTETAGKPGEDSPEVKFRRSHLGDREAIKQLHERAFRGTGAYIEPDEGNAWRNNDLEDVEAAYLNQGGEFLVGELKGEIVAMGGLLGSGVE